MAAKSIIPLPIRKFLAPCRSLINARFFLISVSSVFLLGNLVSCGPGESVTKSPTSVPSTTATGLTATAESTIGPGIKVSSTQQIIGTPIAFSSPSENIFLPIEFTVSFISELESLPAGTYLVDSVADAQSNFEEFRFVSTSGTQEGRLLLVEEIINLKDLFFRNGTTVAIGGFPIESTRYLFNLSRMEAYEFDVCSGQRPAVPSPSGTWLVTICTNRGELQNGSVLVELISLSDGMKYLMEIPSHSRERSASNIIRWVSENRFIAEVGINDEPCLINIQDRNMSCSPEFKDKPFVDISPKGTYLLFNQSSGYSWIKEIYLTKCFENKTKCDPIAHLDDEFTSSDRMYWSPDESMLAVDFGDPLTSEIAEVGYYDVKTWTYHQLEIIPRSSGFFDWCPDSACMIIVGEDSFLLYLDAQKQDIPHELNNPIKVIEVP